MSILILETDFTNVAEFIELPAGCHNAHNFTRQSCNINISLMLLQWYVFHVHWLMCILDSLNEQNMNGKLFKE